LALAQDSGGCPLAWQGRPTTASLADELLNSATRAPAFSLLGRVRSVAPRPERT